MQRFVKGYTNNHLTWVMVDATDFATPESALSAATKIKIYGKVKGGTGVNFVSSGTGSLTNDIQHVGASALGIYTIALAKADLSDASQAWYDQYVISLSATGAAYQTLIVDGGIMESYLSNLLSNMSSIQSDVYSAVVVTQSAASDAASAAQQANSRVILVQSRLSDFNSVYTSDISDIKSMLTHLSDAISDAQSDLRSFIGAGVSLDASTMSDLRSAIAAGPAATVTASDISDIASAVWAFTTRKLTSNISLNASDMSDIRSAIAAGPAATVTASDISDIASAVWAHTVGTRVDSRVLVIQSMVSDAHSAAVVAQSISASDMSDIRSAINATTLSASDLSDIASAVWARKYVAIGEANSTMASILLKGISTVSDIKSLLDAHVPDLSAVLSDFYSDFQSRVPKAVATNSQLSDLMSDAVSDLRSLIGAGVTVSSGGITSASFGAGAIDAAALAAGAGQEIADEILNRNLAGGGSGNTRNVRNALRVLRNKVTNSSGVYTVYQEDDTTKAFSGATSTAAGNPIVSVDPS